MPATITVKDALKSIGSAVLRTPTIYSPGLSEQTGAEVWLKLENLQITGSFKVRGAYIKLMSLQPDQRKAGVVAASAGNHAQGVAYHASKLGIPATIVMPETTPFTKVARTEALGATVLLYGESFSEAVTKAYELVEKNNLTFIPPYDDPDIYLGQGSLMLEFIEDAPELDAVIVPIGGGGLISGCCLAIREANAKTAVFGVQSALYPSMIEAMAGVPSTSGGRTIAEGIAVKTPGNLTKPIIKENVETIFKADETAIEIAVHTLLTEQHLVAEGAGAASLAALLENKSKFKGKRVGLVISGGNIDSRTLSAVLMRGLVRQGRLARLRIEIPDTPGSLSKATGVIGANNGNIIEIHHRRLFHNVPIKLTEVDVVIETVDDRQLEQIISALNEAGFPTSILKGTSVADPG